MKEQIQRLSKGMAVYERPEVRISQTNLRLKVNTGAMLQGNFLIESIGDKPIRGIIYSSDHRMQCKNNQFESVSFCMEYSFDAAYLNAGDIVSGTFFAVTNGGEYEIPYTILVEGELFDGIKNLDAFAVQAREQEYEAYRFFKSAGFSKMLEREAAELLPVYQVLKKKGLTRWDMEEFLIAVGRKDQIALSLSTEEKVIYDLDHSKRIDLILTKNTWGYLPLELEADGAFIRLDKQQITTEAFSGNEYILSYIVDKHRVHKGNNYGSISIKSPYGILRCKVSVVSSLDREEDGEGAKERKKLEADLLSLYTRFRMRSINKDYWTKYSLLHLEQLRNLDEENEVFPLFQVQMYLAGQRMEEAKWILDKFAKKRWGKGKQYDLYAYYLYLSTIYRKDANYTRQVSGEIKKLYSKDKKWEYLWCLFYLNADYIHNPELKMTALRKQYEQGNRNSILYLEGALMIEKDPLLLQQMDAFTVHLLSFYRKRGNVTKEAAVQAAELASKTKDFSSLLFHILEDFYDRFPEPEILMAICSLLIKGNRREEKYFRWYQLGASKGLRLAGIYEYYMYSLDSDREMVYPKPLLLYFSYQTNLDEKKKAQLYAGIIAQAEDDPDLYARYRLQITEFAREQLKKRMISKDLKVIYRTFLNAEEMGQEEKAALARMLFIHELKVENPNIKMVIAVHKEWSQEQRAICVNGSAYLSMYTENCRLIFQDAQGICYQQTIPCQVTKLLADRSFEELCEGYFKHTEGYMLRQYKNGGYSNDMTEIYHALYKNEWSSKFLKEEIQRKVLLSFSEIQSQEWVEGIMADFDIQILFREERALLFRLFLEQGMFQRALKFLSVYGLEIGNPREVGRLASYFVKDKSYEEDPEVLELAWYAFTKDASDGNILEYLCCYFNRDTFSMARVWSKAKELEKDTADLEERLLVQHFFTGQYIAAIYSVFGEYLQKKVNPMVVKAFLIQKSHDYFVRNTIEDESLFSHLQNFYRKEQELFFYGKLALLKYYSSTAEKEDRRNDVLGQFIQDCIGQNQIFACLGSYPEEMIAPYFLREFVIVEHRARPGTKVSIRYRIQGIAPEQDRREDMKEALPGVFTIKVLLFYGEVLEYTMFHENEEIHRGEMKNINARSGNDRFGKINTMYQLLEQGKTEALEQKIKAYLREEQQAEMLFPLI